jgi:hypothetical protein
VKTFSANSLAEQFEIDRGVAVRALRSTKPDATVSGKPQWKIATAAKALEKHRAKNGGISNSESGGGKSLSTQRARLANAQATKAEFQNALACGDYVKVSVMRRFVEVMFNNFREQCLSLAGKVADSLTPYTPQDRSAVHAAIKSEVVQMLEGFADPQGVIGRAVSETAKVKTGS